MAECLQFGLLSRSKPCPSANTCSCSSKGNSSDTWQSRLAPHDRFEVTIPWRGDAPQNSTVFNLNTHAPKPHAGRLAVTAAFRAYRATDEATQTKFQHSSTVAPPACPKFDRGARFFDLSGLQGHVDHGSESFGRYVLLASKGPRGGRQSRAILPPVTRARAFPPARTIPG